MSCFNEDCPQEGTPKLFLCSRCKYVKYCSKNCQLACLSYHKKNCIDPKKTVFNLMRCAYSDDFADMSKELKASYGFEKCQTQQEWVNLFGLYQGLIKHLGCDINELDRAFCENKVPEFVVSKFFNDTRPENCGEYFKWFIQDLERCRH
ncbi:MAG: hypothetical protein J3R72DRAFT_492831 [Linnemannia gamsii]|nr:MAG: hypothetical protein J3R72DRAFT_492831 [Linnemannia gamsii]